MTRYSTIVESMIVWSCRFFRSFVLSLLLVVLGSVAWGQNSAGGGTETTQSSPEGAGQAEVPATHEGAKVESVESIERPLPDIPALMHEVEIRQRESEKLLKNYLYREVATAQQSDGHGGLKKTETKEYDVFWLNGVQVHKLVKKDGKELSAEEQKKESDRIDKEVAKAKERRTKAEAKGQETDSNGHEEITVSRFLELGSFTNPRRLRLADRDTIAVDYAGDPKAKTRNRSEDVVRDLAGTVWVDEQDHVISRLEGHLLNTFKIGGGLLVNIQKDTNFAMDQKKINDEVWLPAKIDARGAARAMLFFKFNGSIRVVSSDYRKFKATSTILPVSTENSEDDLPR